MGKAISSFQFKGDAMIVNKSIEQFLVLLPDFGVTDLKVISFFPLQGLYV